MGKQKDQLEIYEDQQSKKVRIELSLDQEPASTQNQIKKFKIKLSMIDQTRSQLHSHNTLQNHVVAEGEGSSRIQSEATEENKNTCCICRKNFQTGKALYGHMRVHPNRGWKGIRPPQRESDKPIKELINKDKKRKIETVGALPGEEHVDYDNNKKKKAMIRNRFICCNKSFRTPQELGRHRTSHEKDRIEGDQHEATVPLQETNEGKIEQPHESKVYNTASSTSEDRRGHQRSPSGGPIDDTSSSATSQEDNRIVHRQPLTLDLNEPPPLD